MSPRHALDYRLETPCNPVAANEPSARVATLPMYDLPELEAANDEIWAALAARLQAAGVDGVPQTLARGGSLASLWADPQLLLAQTCGYPLIKGEIGPIQLVATPAYHAPGCEGPFHRSVVVVRADHAAASLADMRGTACALNDPSSNTGMNLLRSEVARLARGRAFFERIVVTGSHAASAEAVAEGTADLAALDVVTFAQLTRHRPQLMRRLKPLAWTTRSPGLPLITSVHTDRATLQALRDGLDEIARDPALRSARAELMLDGFHRLSKAHYHEVLYLEETAQTQGFPRLH